MEKLLQFRLTFDSFNEHEFELFCTKLFEIYDKKEILIKALFYLALHEYKYNNYDHITQLNTINKEIIDLRRKKSKTEHNYMALPQTELDDTKKAEPNPFNATPSVIITYIASYMNPSELFLFMECNRYIHISCISLPANIQTLHAMDNYLYNYGFRFSAIQQEKLTRFKMIKTLAFDAFNISVGNFGVNGNKWKWNKLNTLLLNDVEIVQRKDYEYLTNILSKIELKHLMVFGLDALSDHHSYFDGDDDDATMLKHMLLASKGIQHLSIYMEDIPYPLSGFDSADLSQIKALTLGERVDIGDELLCFISNQLESLHIDNIEATLIESSKSAIHYTNLQELCVKSLHEKTISNIIKTASNLRRIHCEISDITVMVSNQLKYMIQELMSLEYLCIGCLVPDQRFSVWKYIQEALKYKRFKRQTMKIRLQYDRITPENLEYITNNLTTFIAILSGSVINDFLFECSFGVDDFCGSDDDFVGIKEKLKELEKQYLVQTIMKSAMIEKIYISNKNNSMHGYAERWMYPCFVCGNINCFL